MKFKPRNGKHQSGRKTGILLMNLGTPAHPDTPSVRRYLKQFLSDPRVVEIPRAVWWLILNGIILNTRPARSAASYRKIWQPEGSPLQTITASQAEKLQSLYDSGEVLVDYAMRYGSPSAEEKITCMLDAGVRRLLVLPLYPQYSASTTASAFDAVAEEFRQRRWLPDFRFVAQYHDRPDYIAALAARIREHQQVHGAAERLLFSFHGMPRRYVTSGDPYACHCAKTARLLREALGLNKEQALLTYQSRFGKAEWLKPYTDQTLKKLAADGVKSVQIVCPGFSADCLETLEEIEHENRDIFLQAGGQRFEYIAALNDGDDHIALLKALADENLSGWI